ncbi:hypothetical protein QUA80_24145 [Microcoleus sp. F4-D5]
MVKETFTLVERAGYPPSTYNLNAVQLLTKLPEEIGFLRPGLLG